MGCGALGVAIWLAMKNQLRKYMTFRFKGTLRKMDRNSVVKVSDMIAGVSRVDLNKATLRIIACNMEKVNTYAVAAAIDEPSASANLRGPFCCFPRK